MFSSEPDLVIILDLGIACYSHYYTPIKGSGIACLLLRRDMRHMTSKCCEPGGWLKARLGSKVAKTLAEYLGRQAWTT